jgi:uncharacterized damage-inducible protein DinB
MPGTVAPVANEREGLLAYLAQMRYVLRLTAHGLTDEQARATPTKSSLSVGGLIKHVALTEQSWVQFYMQERKRDPKEMEEIYHSGFAMGQDETLAGILEFYDRVAAETEKIVDGIEDLGHPVPVPRDQPWFPKDVDAWSVRWVLLHLIQETARHAGHADIVRELIDGATAYPLMAAAENWPPSPWMQPWTPPTAVGLPTA